MCFSIYKDKKVLITGNTGFKGTWMTKWLLKMGANVTGYSLLPEVDRPVYKTLKISKHIKQYLKDIRSYEDLKKCLIETQPEIIFHLAAQPLVLESYRIPMETFDVNIMGTVTLLEAVRELKMDTIIVCITSDKCYENQEWLMGYRETDALGGHDPYSASKGAAEIVISSYRRSFFNPLNKETPNIRVASVRAGNVIGGGDWAKDRIVSDCIRDLEKGKKIFIRSPFATRPWQHVLEPLGGYILLGAKLMENNQNAELFCDSFNFGPNITSNKTVEDLVVAIIENWGQGTWYSKEVENVHEASLLNLSTDKAYHLLNWQPVWEFEETVKRTVDWYKCNFEGGEIIKLTENQIEHYQNSFSSKLKLPISSLV